jgi:hypothetical protein
MSLRHTSEPAAKVGRSLCDAGLAAAFRVPDIPGVITSAAIELRDVRRSFDDCLPSYKTHGVAVNAGCPGGHRAKLHCTEV